MHLKIEALVRGRINKHINIGMRAGFVPRVRADVIGPEEASLHVYDWYCPLEAVQQHLHIRNITRRLSCERKFFQRSQSRGQRFCYDKFIPARN
jgi:hypothetical protein